MYFHVCIKIIFKIYYPYEKYVLFGILIMHMYVQCQYIQFGNCCLNMKSNIWTMKIVISIQKMLFEYENYILNLKNVVSILWIVIWLQKLLFETKIWDFNLDIVMWIPKFLF